MALPGNGARTVNSLLSEISLHLVEPIVISSLSAGVSPGLQTVAVANTNAMYVGAMLVCDTGAATEVITLTAVGANSITAVFANPHPLHAPLSGATFPVQQTTDPIYTQAEMIGYVARAQNEFLEAVPCIFALFSQDALAGYVIQSLPETAIELNRVAASAMGTPITSLVRTGGVVTATFASDHGLVAGNTFWVQSPTDSSFAGVFKVDTAPPLTPDILTYEQEGVDASTTGGRAVTWVRLYELTQEELAMANRQWQSMPIVMPSAFFEDRVGLYRFGLDGRVSVTVPLELLCSIRDSQTLTLLDHFLIPDMLAHGVKYRALAFAFEKDGSWQDPQRAAYCNERFKRIVMATQRFLNGMGMNAQGEG